MHMHIICIHSCTLLCLDVAWLLYVVLSSQNTASIGICENSPAWNTICLSLIKWYLQQTRERFECGVVCTCVCATY